MFTMRKPSRLRRRIAATIAAVALCLPTFVAPPALAQDQNLWGSNINRVGMESPLQLSVTSVSPNVASVGGNLTISVQVHNVSDAQISNVALRLQRASALSSSADARTILAEPESVYDVAGTFTAPVDIRAGETRTITLQANLTAPAPDGLGIVEPGTYPLFINANGQPANDIDQLLSESRLLLPVVETGAQQNSSANEDESPKETDRPVPISLIWPISQPVPLVGGETGEAPSSPDLILTDDSLATSLKPGGQLDGLLSSLENGFARPNGGKLRQSTCIAIDPDTLDAVSRMTREYWIGDSRPSPVKTSMRLRDSWGNQDNDNLKRMAANPDAATWLERLHTLTEHTCVITLPWAGTDVSALARVGDTDLAAEALAAGQHTIAQHIDAQTLPGVYLPAEGYVSTASAPLYFAATALGPKTPERAFEERVQPAPPEQSPTPNPPDAAATTVLVANNTAITDDGQTLAPGHGGALADGSRVFALPSALSTALAATGQLPQTTAYSNVLGRYDLSLDSPTARMQTAIGTLYQSLTDSSQARAGIVAAPPVGWAPSQDDAEQLIDAVAAAIDSNLASPTPLTTSLDVAADELDDGSVTPTAEIANPAPIEESAIVRAQITARELGDLTTIMSNDPNVALTRYEFTQPLRRNLLRVFSLPEARNQQLHGRQQRRSDELSEQALNMTRRLRNSVTLVAPGGVYTRASQLSPIVVLARNGLPLPVPAFVRVGIETAVETEKYEASIPAKGSVTVQFSPKTVDDAEAMRSTDAPDEKSPPSHAEGSHSLLLWLESPNGTAISQSVSVSIRSGSSVKVLLVTAIVIVTVGGFFAAKRSRRFRK